jgi:hypothetical protein
MLESLLHRYPERNQGVALVMERSGSTMRMRSEGADRVKALKVGSGSSNSEASCNWIHLLSGGFQKWGYPQLDGLFHGKYHENGWWLGLALFQETPICKHWGSVATKTDKSYPQLHGLLEIPSCPFRPRIFSSSPSCLMTPSWITTPTNIDEFSCNHHSQL